MVHQVNCSSQVRRVVDLLNKIVRMSGYRNYPVLGREDVRTVGLSTRSKGCRVFISVGDLLNKVMRMSDGQAVCQPLMNKIVRVSERLLTS